MPTQEVKQSVFDGHSRCLATLHWIKNKPVDKEGNKIPIETYMQMVCKAKGWVYKSPPKKVEEYPINVIDRSTNSRIDTNLTHGLAPRDRGYNQAIDDFRQTLNLEPKENINE